jgi:hypothetical protein
MVIMTILVMLLTMDTIKAIAVDTIMPSIMAAIIIRTTITITEIVSTVGVDTTTSIISIRGMDMVDGIIVGGQ